MKKIYKNYGAGFIELLVASSLGLVVSLGGFKSFNLAVYTRLIQKTQLAEKHLNLGISKFFSNQYNCKNTLRPERLSDFLNRKGKVLDKDGHTLKTIPGLEKSIYKNYVSIQKITLENSKADKDHPQRTLKVFYTKPLLKGEKTLEQKDCTEDNTDGCYVQTCLFDYKCKGDECEQANDKCEPLNCYQNTKVTPSQIISDLIGECPEGVPMAYDDNGHIQCYEDIFIKPKTDILCEPGEILKAIKQDGSLECEPIPKDKRCSAIQSFDELMDKCICDNDRDIFERGTPGNKWCECKGLIKAKERCENIFNEMYHSPGSPSYNRAVEYCKRQIDAYFRDGECHECEEGKIKVTGRYTQRRVSQMWHGLTFTDRTITTEECCPIGSTKHVSRDEFGGSDYVTIKTVHNEYYTTFSREVIHYGKRKITTCHNDCPIGKEQTIDGTKKCCPPDKRYYHTGRCRFCPRGAHRTSRGICCPSPKVETTEGYCCPPNEVATADTKWQCCPQDKRYYWGDKCQECPEGSPYKHTNRAGCFKCKNESKPIFTGDSAHKRHKNKCITCTPSDKLRFDSDSNSYYCDCPSGQYYALGLYPPKCRECDRNPKGGTLISWNKCKVHCAPGQVHRGTTVKGRPLCCPAGVQPGRCCISGHTFRNGKCCPNNGGDCCPIGYWRHTDGRCIVNYGWSSVWRGEDGGDGHIDYHIY